MSQTGTEEESVHCGPGEDKLADRFPAPNCPELQLNI